MYEISRAVHGPARWRNDDIRINCLLSTSAKLISIEKEREEVRMQLEDLERARECLEAEERELAIREQESQERLQHETSKIQTDFVEYRDQMNELTKRVNDQLILLEAVRGNLGKGSRTAPSRAGGFDRDKEKINKPPTFPPFSGIEPTPKDECGIETLLFQVKGARKDVTEQAV